MTQDQKRALQTLGFGALALAILYMLFKGCPQTIVNMTSQPGGNTLPPLTIPPGTETPGPSIHWPDVPPFDPGSINLNPVYNAGGCSCGCTDTGPFMAQAQAALDAYDANLTTISNRIIDAYTASLPPGVAQYLNNNQAAANYQASTSTLSNGF